MELNQEKVKVWEQKARHVYQQGVNIFKEGIKGLELVADKTLEVGKLKIANQKALSRIRELFVDLGHRVYDLVAHQAGPTIKLTPDIFNFVEQIKKVQSLLDFNLKKIKHSTTVAEVKKQGKKQQSSPKKKLKKRPSRKK